MIGAAGNTKEASSTKSIDFTRFLARRPCPVVIPQGLCHNNYIDMQTTESELVDQ
jgi:hypothetical protein